MGDVRIGIATVPGRKWAFDEVVANRSTELIADPEVPLVETLREWQRTNTLVAVVDDDLVWGDDEVEDALVEWAEEVTYPPQRIVLLVAGDRPEDDAFLYRLVSEADVKDIVIASRCPDLRRTMAEVVESPMQLGEVSQWKTSDAKLLSRRQPGLLSTLAGKPGGKAKKDKKKKKKKKDGANPPARATALPPSGASEADVLLPPGSTAVMPGIATESQTPPEPESEPAAAAEEIDMTAALDYDALAAAIIEKSEVAFPPHAKAAEQSSAVGGMVGSTPEPERPEPVLESEPEPMKTQCRKVDAETAVAAAEDTPADGSSPRAEDFSGENPSTASHVKREGGGPRITGHKLTIAHSLKPSPALRKPAAPADPDLGALPPDAANVVAVAALRGGIGCTFLCAALGAMLGSEGIAVAVAMRNRRELNSMGRALADAKPIPDAPRAFRWNGADFYAWDEQGAHSREYDVVVCDCSTVSFSSADPASRAGTFKRADVKVMLASGAPWDTGDVPRILATYSVQELSSWIFALGYGCDVEVAKSMRETIEGWYAEHGMSRAGRFMSIPSMRTLFSGGIRRGRIPQNDLIALAPALAGADSALGAKAMAAAKGKRAAAAKKRGATESAQAQESLGSGGEEAED